MSKRIASIAVPVAQAEFAHGSRSGNNFLSLHYSATCPEGHQSEYCLWHDPCGEIRLVQCHHCGIGYLVRFGKSLLDE